VRKRDGGEKGPVLYMKSMLGGRQNLILHVQLQLPFS